MTTVIERLIESWLDNQTERRYQPAFIQLLISQGWTVLHNTRHSPIELGKDVIARHPDGRLHCFQLKGNPGSRVTKREAQGLLPQFVELIELEVPASYCGREGEQHVAVFVTNGEIDEEARLVFQQAGARAGRGGTPAASYELWTRGTLAQMFSETAGRVWPTSVEGSRQVLNIMAQDGLELPDFRSISAFFVAAAPKPTSKTVSAKKSSDVSALLLLTEIVKSPWYRSENHYALYQISVLCGVYALQFCDTSKRRDLVRRYVSLALEHCSDLIREAESRGFDPDKMWWERDPLAEFDVMRERRRLVGDCAATLILSGALSPNREFEARLVEATVQSPFLWGLGAVPAFIVRYWAYRTVSAMGIVDLSLGATLLSLCKASLGRLKDVPFPPSPYYGFVECLSLTTGIQLTGDNPFEGDHFERRMWFGRALLFMLAKRNWKQTCRLIWPSFSRAVHEEPDLPHRVFYSTQLSRAGRMRVHTYHGKEWRELVVEAVSEGSDSFLVPHSEFAWLIAAYIALVPYRAWTEVLMWLDQSFNPTWYHEGHLPA